MTHPIVWPYSGYAINWSHGHLEGLLESSGGLPTTVWLEYWGEHYTPHTDTPHILAGATPFLWGEDITVDSRDTHIGYSAHAQNADGQFYPPSKLYWNGSINPSFPGSLWLITTYEDHFVAAIKHVTFTTDVACHLFAYVAPSAPHKKWGVHLKRGTVFHHAPKVSWWSKFKYEQNETGDTPTHTFDIPFTEDGQTLWWYFSGYTHGKRSPSVSPFFHNQYIAPPPPLLFCEQPQIVPLLQFSFPPETYISYCIRPSLTLTPEKLIIWVRKSPYYAQPNSLHISFFTADSLGKPLVQLAPDTTINLPALLETPIPVEIPLDNVPALTKEINYAFAAHHVLEEGNWSKRLYYAEGMDETCPLSPPNNTRTYTGAPGSWTLFGNAGFQYQLYGQPEEEP